MADIDPAIIASAESFGTPLIVMNIAVTGAIASAEAVPSPQVNMTIQGLALIVSGEAVGSPVVAGAITATAIPSAESVPEPIRLTLFIADPTPIPSAESFGTPVIADIQPEKIASGESFGIAVLAGPINPSAIESAEAVPQPVAAGPITTSAIASAEAVPSPSISQLVTVPAIASTSQVFAPQINTILVVLIPSAESVPTPIAAGPVIVGLIPSAEAFGQHQITKFIDVVLPDRANSGPLDGTATFKIISSLNDMDSCDPVGWDDVSTSSGTSDDVTLSLDTGFTLAAIAGLRQPTPEATIDVEICASTAEIELALFESSSTVFRVKSVGSLVTVTITVSGTTTFDLPVTSASRQLRIQRNGTEVRVFVRGRKVLTQEWVATAAAPEVRVVNAGTRIKTRVQAVTRRSVILFDGVAAEQVSVRSEVLAVGSAPVSTRTGLVDVTVVGCNDASDVLVDGFTYELPENKLTVGQNPTRGETLTELTDPAVRS